MIDAKMILVESPSGAVLQGTDVAEGAEGMLRFAFWLLNDVKKDAELVCCSTEFLLGFYQLLSFWVTMVCNDTWDLKEPSPPDESRGRW